LLDALQIGRQDVFVEHHEVGEFSRFDGADRKRSEERLPHTPRNGRLENQESKLNKEVRTDRKANGGNLTNNEKKQINQQQNKLSNQIYKDKHNGQNQQK
jgi:hypothetical protein